MIPYDQVQFDVLYWAYVKRNRKLDVIRVYHPYGEPKGAFVKGTDESIFNQYLEDYIVLAPCLVPAEILDEASTLRIEGVAKDLKGANLRSIAEHDWEENFGDHAQGAN